VVNRLLCPYMNEALKMLERGEWIQSTVVQRTGTTHLYYCSEKACTNI
jgi:3-hydroxyacyl-CoA dehydrogenase